MVQRTPRKKPIKRKSAKDRGRRLQNWVRDTIEEHHGFAPDVAIMGESGKDVKHDRLPYSIECKNVERLNIWDAWKQAKSNCADGDTPVVVFTRNYDDKLAVVPAEWLIKRLEINDS